MKGSSSKTPFLPKTRNRTRRLWGVFAPLLFTFALAWFVWSERARLQPVWDAPAPLLVLVALLVIIGHFLNSGEFWLLYRAVGVQVGVFEHWMLFTGGQLANHLPARIGTLYRFRYMEVVRSAPYMKSAAVYGANLAVTLAGASVMGLLGVAGTVLFTDAELPTIVLLAFAGIGVVAIAVATIPLPPFGGRDGRLARWWRDFHAGFEQIRRRPQTATCVLLLESLKYLITAWRFQIAFSLVGIQRPFWVFLVVGPAAGVAGFIGLTPAALGFREAFITGAASAMGVEMAPGLLGATVDRAVLFAVSMVLGSAGLLLTYTRLAATHRSPRNPESHESPSR